MKFTRCLESNISRFHFLNGITEILFDDVLNVLRCIYVHQRQTHGTQEVLTLGVYNRGESGCTWRHTGMCLITSSALDQLVLQGNTHQRGSRHSPVGYTGACSLARARGHTGPVPLPLPLPFCWHTWPAGAAPLHRRTPSTANKHMAKMPENHSDHLQAVHYRPAGASHSQTHQIPQEFLWSLL